ncbi:hypothetical protein HDV05_006534, partial [Chytridiales sp. JEL 0842]
MRPKTARGRQNEEEMKSKAEDEPIFGNFPSVKCTFVMDEGKKKRRFADSEAIEIQITPEIVRFHAPFSSEDPIEFKIAGTWGKKVDVGSGEFIIQLKDLTKAIVARVTETDVPLLEKYQLLSGRITNWEMENMMGEMKALGAVFVDKSRQPNVISDSPEKQKSTNSTDIVLVYPQKGKSSVTIYRDDMRRLNDGEFLNDTLIEFFLKYISIELCPERDEKFYIFSTFFYQQLTQKDDTAKYSKPSPETAYNRVRRWTKGVDIFAKELIFVPINEHMHWYLAVIVNPAAFLKKKESDTIEDLTDDTSPSSDTQCEILIFDSLTGKHPSVSKTLSSYLRHEAMDKGKGGALEKDLPCRYPR